MKRATKPYALIDVEKWLVRKAERATESDGKSKNPPSASPREKKTQRGSSSSRTKSKSRSPARKSHRKKSTKDPSKESAKVRFNGFPYLVHSQQLLPTFLASYG